jgi:FtsP/CotA-like multicopper oxidase with cupredoxin domain
MRSLLTLEWIKRRLVFVALLAFVVVTAYGGSATATPAEMPSSGIVCTSNSSSTFTLTANEGHISMTDGNTIHMWSYSEGQDDFQYPGPVLCVNQGDTVTVVLHNNLPEDVSIVFPGQQDVLANGLPAQPQFNGGVLTSLTNAAPKNGGSVTYSFVAGEPGTYLYESGTNPSVQVQMGLVGALIVRPAGHPDWAYNRADSVFNPETEYLLLLSEIDPIMHQAIERGETFDMSNYHARYFLINGRAFPDTISPNGASWLPYQPYGSLAHIHPYDSVANPLPALSRYIGVGASDYPFHPHAFNGRVIARDGRPLQGPNGEDLSYEQFTVLVGAGQTVDVLFDWKDTSAYSPDGNPIPVDIPGEQNLTYGPFYGSAYLGNQDILPVGTTSYNQCGEFYHIAHNHALQQLVGWGVVMTGQTTFTRIDPPLPNNCP